MEGAVKAAQEDGASDEVLEELNSCLMKVGRCVNPVAHSNAGDTEQLSMETFGRTPFPRIHEITELADMPLHQSPEFKFLRTKLIRQRNAVEDGFYRASELIRETLANIK